jgi:VIT1/CCC1 family predicted Fe2+/Mn2+ transporter
MQILLMVIGVNPVPANPIIIAGSAETAAEAISMGLGEYLAARTDFEHYASERKREFGLF